MTAAPLVSVVIPTRNRSDVLRRTLDALERQTAPRAHVEIIVVADGCTDDTLAVLAERAGARPVTVVTTPGGGAAAARNAGAARASAPLLLFLDDDVEPTPGLVAAHLDAQRRRPGCVALGPYPPAWSGPLDLHRIVVRDWWVAQFHAMAQAGHRWSYRDVLSGNLSIPAELFARVGGFDGTIPGAGGEDWELGIRLIAAGAELVLVPEALAHHHESSDAARSFRRARQEGRTDVHIARRHPACRITLPLATEPGAHERLKRVLRGLAFRAPRLGGAACAVAALALGPLERLRFRRSWRAVANAIRYFAYWRGVAEALGSTRALAAFLQSAPLRPAEADGEELEIDLAVGLDAAERLLDEHRPASARLRLGAQAVGRIPPYAAAERLRGAHLRPFLATHLAVPLLLAHAREGLARPSALDVGATAEGAHVAQGV